MLHIERQSLFNGCTNTSGERLNDLLQLSGIQERLVSSHRETDAIGLGVEHDIREEAQLFQYEHTRKAKR